MNKHVQMDDLPFLTDLDSELRNEIRQLIDTGYVWEAVSKGGIRASYAGYRYIVEAIELLLTDENPRRNAKLMRILADTHQIPESIIQSAIVRACQSASFDDCRKYIFDEQERSSINSKVFSMMNSVLLMSYFVSHCVDYAEAELAQKHAN